MRDGRRYGWALLLCGTAGVAQATVNFQPAIEVAAASGDCCREAMLLGDLDADGDIDAVVREYVSPVGFRWQVHHNQGGGNFVPGPGLAEASGWDHGAASLLDLDHDGYLDLVTTVWGQLAPSAGVLRVAYGDGAGGFDAPIDVAPLPTRVRLLLPGDVDADGDTDLVAMSDQFGEGPDGSSGQLYELVVLVDDTGVLRESERRLLPFNRPLVGLLPFDADGLPDLVLGGEGQALVVLNQAGRFTSAAVTAPGLSTRLFGIQAGDPDPQGRPELISLEYGTRGVIEGDTADCAVRVHGRDSAGLPSATAVAAPMQCPDQRVQVVDLDADGRREILVATRLRGAPLAVHVRASDATLPQAAMFRATRPVLAADLDGDGRPDLLTGGRGRGLHLLRGVASPNRAPEVSAAIARLDGSRMAQGVIWGVDLDDNPLTYQVVDPPRQARNLVLDGHTGVYTYFAQRGASGSDHFTVRVSDRSGGSVDVRVLVGLGTGGGGAPEPLWLGALSVLALFSVRRRAARAQGLDALRHVLG